MSNWFDGRAQIWGDIEPAHDKFYSLQQQRTVSIASPVGQAQFYLGGVFPWPGRPEETLLLCRFANTIDISCGEPELRQLKRLRRHLDTSRFEKKHGHANPLVAREVEREILQRLSPDYAVGYDLTPAMRLLAEQERDGPMFTQPERNLLLRVAFDTGDNGWVEDIAQQFREKTCSRSRLVDICRRLEQVELSWLDMDTMHGLSYLSTKHPGFSMDLQGCEDPMKHYPPFARYPSVHVPPWGAVLQNGTMLFQTQEAWWRSGIRKVDQTFTAPHFYKRDGMRYQIADQEHRMLFQQQRDHPELEPEPGMTMGGMAL